MTTSMHWSRWGDPAHVQPAPDALRALVIGAFGVDGTVAPGVPLADVRPSASRLPHGFVDALRSDVGAEYALTDDASRIRHTRGKSLPDLVRMRAGEVSDAPDVVVRPADHDEVAQVLARCVEQHVALVPFGGGTSVVGGLAARADGFAGVLALDLARLDSLLALDPDSRTATLGAGLTGPAAEGLLAEHGYTLGHFPQSYEYASIGGYAATRSSGQSSAGYGRFDAMVLGLRIATPLGTWELGHGPASAAGPDLRQLVLGSEGAFGVITSVTVRVRPAPEQRSYDAWTFPSFTDGMLAARLLAQDGPVPTVLRVSDEAETAVGLAKPDQVGGAPISGGVTLIAGYESSTTDVERTRHGVSEVLAGLGAQQLPGGEGDAWARGRFAAPYLRDSLLDLGVLVETVETATCWARLAEVYDAVRQALTDTLTEAGTPPLVLCHVSHVYPSGASLYFTVVARLRDVDTWLAAKAAATTAMVAHDATITHHHGVGRDHQPWLVDEIGEVGVEVLRAVKARIDPTGVLNPGILIP